MHALRLRAWSHCTAIAPCDARGLPPAAADFGLVNPGEASSAMETEDVPRPDGAARLSVTQCPGGAS